MYALLFGEALVDRQAIRVQAREQVYTSRLIRDCAAGRIGAVRALLTGFWPFVEEFEKAIDRQVARLPIKPLVERFGPERTREFFQSARMAVREMREEEGSHAALWRESAERIGADLGGNDIVPGVKALLDGAETRDPVQFFCWLAGTEYIAEELAAYLCNSPAFLDVFPGRRWSWGDAHVLEHDGPSHLEIDEDLARAYHMSENPSQVAARLSQEIRTCQCLFGAAAADVLEHASLLARVH